jgi:HlyD family secretion protein
VLRVSNDALRFRPRDAAASAPQSGGAQAAERGERLVEQMKGALKLTDEQVAMVQEVMRKGAAARAERQKARAGQGEGQGQGAEGSPSDGRRNASGGGQAGGPGGGPDAAAMRNRFMERIETALEPTLSAEQKPLLEHWRQQRQTGRMTSVWTLGPVGQPEQRQVRLGIADDQFAEVIGGGIKQGDSVITRQRQTVKR